MHRKPVANVLSRRHTCICGYFKIVHDNMEWMGGSDAMVVIPTIVQNFSNTDNSHYIFRSNHVSNSGTQTQMYSQILHYIHKVIVQISQIQERQSVRKFIIQKRNLSRRVFCDYTLIFCCFISVYISVYTSPAQM
ncbi:Hypothetical_protein [Hexamita inflata]|uniref:Hypothetical_protein n=1 Tax=Hexamita inflata TaxID=28002 RepID=A0AA86QXZ2_9EUKA|nr:Hypothetical protein HINF_LOCUS52947 [Hexamita inflata]CAI9965303.1 Hypothetical protein HINF_LOCUS52948 [Hexamita inflata]